MPRPLQPIQFHGRRRSAVVRQSGPGRTTLHLDLARSAGSTSAARGGRRPAHGWRGRRGWWGSTRRMPDFVEFWGLGGTNAATTVDQSRDGQGDLNGQQQREEQQQQQQQQQQEQQEQQQQQQEEQRQGSPGSFFRSPEFVILILGLASLLAFIVFISDLASNRSFRPMTVLVFVAAGTYCIALFKQQRVLAAAEQALVIEIIDGSAESARRAVISKEDRRALFDYFTFRAPDTEKPPAASAAADVDDGTAGEEALPGEHGTARPVGVDAPLSRSRSLSLSSSLARSARRVLQRSSSASDSSGNGAFTPPLSVDGDAVLRSAASPSGAIPKTAIAMEEGVADQGEGSSTAADIMGTGASADQQGSATLPPSSGEALASTMGSSEACPVFHVGSGVGEAVGTVGGQDSGDSEPTAVPEGSGLGERPREDHNTRRGMGRSGSELWSTAGSCIVCFGDYADGDMLCRLPCRHTYHAECIDAWLDGPNHAWCPLCKCSLLPPGRSSSSNSTSRSNSTANLRSDAADGVNTRGSGIGTARGTPVADGTTSSVAGDEAV